jgi:translation initiation factor 1
MGLVYSTAHGRHCPECGKPKAECVCGKARQAPRGDGAVRVGREVRKGAGVTVISGLPLEGEALKALAKELKASCGSGGTVKDGVIEIQGEHRDRVLAELAKRGWKGKRSGG